MIREKKGSDEGSGELEKNNSGEVVDHRRGGGIRHGVLTSTPGNPDFSNYDKENSWERKLSPKKYRTKGRRPRRREFTRPVAGPEVRITFVEKGFLADRGGRQVEPER